MQKSSNTLHCVSVPAHPIYWGGGKEKKGGERMKDILMIRKAATMNYN